MSLPLTSPKNLKPEYLNDTDRLMNSIYKHVPDGKTLKLSNEYSLHNPEGTKNGHDNLWFLKKGANIPVLEIIGYDQDPETLNNIGFFGAIASYQIGTPQEEINALQKKGNEKFAQSVEMLKNLVTQFLEKK